MLQVLTKGTVRTPLADSIVSLESPQAKAAVEPAPGTEIVRSNRLLPPQVSVDSVGSSGQFPNRGKVRHLVYSFSPLTFEFGLHTVVETPYYRRSGADAKLALDNIPPGNYRLRMWHQNPTLGAAATDQALSLAATGQSVTVKVAGLTP
jgi:hypothetical protein